MNDDALAEALAVLRSADALRRVLPHGSRDREMIDAHMLILDREIRGLVMTNAEDFDAEAVRLRAVARATEIRVAQAQAGWRK